MTHYTTIDPSLSGQCKATVRVRRPGSDLVYSFNRSVGTTPYPEPRDVRAVARLHPGAGLVFLRVPHVPDVVYGLEPPAFTCECPLGDDEGRSLYRVTGHDGDVTYCAYCSACADLARCDWNGETASIVAV